MIAFDAFKHFLRGSRYCIGVVEGYKPFEKFDYKRIHWLDLNGYKNGWFADPFILKVEDENFTVLAEEWYYPINHGRLSKLTVARNGFRLLSVKPILQLETHLSFPYIVRDGGKLYVCPENQESGSVSIYEYDVDADRLVRPVKLIDKPLMDVQLVQNRGGINCLVFSMLQASKPTHGHYRYIQRRA